MITLHTNHGAISIELDFENAPQTAANFLAHARNGYYDGTIFHRVIDNFMVQGGGFEPGMKQKSPGQPIDNEADNGLQNLAGTLAMARTADPHSASCQFFINVADNDFLNHRSKDPQGWGYAVFGRVVDGMDIVKLIKEVDTTSRAGHEDVPVEDVIIESTVISEDE